MAPKTLTIDLETSEALGRHKREGQSFSQVIREQVGGRKTGRSLLGAMDKATLSDSTLAAVERVVEGRGEDSAWSVEP